LFSGSVKASDGFGNPYYNKREWGGCHVDRNEVLRRHPYQPDSAGPSSRPTPPVPQVTNRPKDYSDHTVLRGIYVYTDRQNEAWFVEQHRSRRTDSYTAGRERACEILSTAHRRITRFRCNTETTVLTCSLASDDGLQCSFTRTIAGRIFKESSVFRPAEVGGGKIRFWVVTELSKRAG